MTGTTTDRFNTAPEEGIKAPCRMATTANVTLSGLQTVDGIVGVANDRVLVKDQTDATENGIYLMQSTAWGRSPDWNDNSDVTGSGILVPISLGTASGVWRTVYAGTFSVGATSVTFEQSLFYTHPTTAGNKHIPAGGAAGNILEYSADGTAVWAAPAAGGGGSPFATDIIVNGLTVGRGLGDLDSNTAVGNGALDASTTGYDNVAVGKNALGSVTTAFGNVAIGWEALAANLTGNNNVGIGRGALKVATYGPNVAIGGNSMTKTTTGWWNVAVGESALLNNLTGQGNVAIGVDAINLNTAGHGNTGIGASALVSTTGVRNTGIGHSALSSVTTGSGNVGIGPLNAAVGYTPIFDPTTENNRVCLGSTAVTNAYIKVAWTVVSDARDKTSFAPVPHGLNFVLNLKPTAYRFREDRDSDVPTGITRYGFLAQDILELEGDTPVIIDDEDIEKLRFNSESLIPVLVNAIKEQNDLISALTKRLEVIEGGRR